MRSIALRFKCKPWIALEGNRPGTQKMRVTVLESAVLCALQHLTGGSVIDGGSVVAYPDEERKLAFVYHVGSQLE